MRRHHWLASGCVIALAAGLTACGGSSGGGNRGRRGGPLPRPPTPGGGAAHLAERGHRGPGQQPAERRHPATLTTPALAIVDAKKVQAAGGSDGSDAAKSDKAETALNTTSEGSGPYTLTSYSTTTQVVLTA